jgi:SNF family Na+-dependent transporter
MLEGNDIVRAIVWVVVAGVVFWLLTWLIDYAGLKEPFNRVAKIMLAILAVVFLINIIMMVMGRPFIRW